MKFKNKITGSIVSPTNEFVIDQMRKSDTFEEIKEIKIVKKEVSEIKLEEKVEEKIEEKVEKPKKKTNK